jgi:hypothetical protein
MPTLAVRFEQLEFCRFAWRTSPVQVLGNHGAANGLAAKIANLQEVRRQLAEGRTESGLLALDSLYGDIQLALGLSRVVSGLSREGVIRLLDDALARLVLFVFISMILAAFTLALILLLAALAHRPATLAFTLLLVAVYRCFGRRGETDDVLVSARQSLSAVAGRRSERQ